ncbi:MAG: hypothetical protein ACYTFF_09445 [Planctomycetota bacterium]|jgi:hypothetical protein
MNAQNLAVVVTADSEFEAETKAEALRARGLKAMVTRNAPSWTGHASISPTARGASVLVHREDLERAKAILKQVISDSVDIDWDEVDVGQRQDDLPLHKVNRMPALAIASFAVAVAIIAVTVIWLLTAILANLF